MTHQEAIEADNQGLLDKQDKFLLKFYEHLRFIGVINIMSFKDFAEKAYDISSKVERNRFVVKTKDKFTETYSGGQYYSIQTAKFWFKQWISSSTFCGYIFDIERNLCYVPRQFEKSFEEDRQQITISIKSNSESQDFDVEFIDF